jgi:Glycosyl hydrolase family 57
LAPEPRAAGQLRLMCLFHLNLAFSSLEEHAHREIVRRCYRPALELMHEADFPIAIEATGWTLRRIAELDPDWLELARELLDAGRLELVGSAHAQCAAPLLPAEVNAWNLRLGRESYAELLGIVPRVALVCEQVYSPGLVPLYLQAGYEAIVVDWDNAYRSHGDWPRERRHLPQRAVGGGSSIPVLWSESIAFQKFQRFAHGELSLDRYLGYVQAVADDFVGGRHGMLMLYANDAEVFDHRPGRFTAEPDLAEEGEWRRIAQALRALRVQGIGEPALPSAALELLDGPDAGHELRLEGPAQPIPVKKQDKYNVSRWAVTGRDDIGVNTRCWRLYERLHAADCTDPDAWRELCELWASDFRTHITEARWDAFLRRLEGAEQRWSLPPSLAACPLPSPCPPLSPPLPLLPPLPPNRVQDAGRRGQAQHRTEPYAGTIAVNRAEDRLELHVGTLELRLNTRRGMAIEAFGDTGVCDRPLLGTLEHGYFPTIQLGADFYSGHLVQESPLMHKVTDLERTRPEVGRDERGRPCAVAQIATELGPIEKSVALDAASGSVEIAWMLHWQELPPGSLRAGHVTLLPEAFQARTLWYATHNGGAALEAQAIAGPAFDHGAAVSTLVSCRQGLGMTEGVVLVGDAEYAIRVELDQECARPLGLVSWTPAGERWLLRLSFALAESDETRRGGIPRGARTPQRMRMRISAERTPVALGGAVENSLPDFLE